MARSEAQIKFLNDKMQGIADSILDGIESGSAWKKPWSFIPAHNAGTGRAYTMGNQFLISLLSAILGYENPAFLTFNQAKKLGGNVKKEESKNYIPVPFYKVTKKTDDESGKDKMFFNMSIFYVYNISQCENIDPSKLKRAKGTFFNNDDRHPSEDERYAKAWEFFEYASQGMNVSYGGQRAAYSLTHDRIVMPERNTFKDNASFFSTLFHEMAHWTGEKSRCNRVQTGKFGTSTYAEEELVAELTSAMICGLLGIQGSLQHKEYFNHWRENLAAKQVMQAAKNAYIAAHYLLDLAAANGMQLNLEDESNYNNEEQED
jgi:antirestriction protein ArdC